MLSVLWDHSENAHMYLMVTKNPFVMFLYYIIRKGTEFQKMVTEIVNSPDVVSQKKYKWKRTAVICMKYLKEKIT